MQWAEFDKSIILGAGAILAAKYLPTMLLKTRGSVYVSCSEISRDTVVPSSFFVSPPDALERCLDPSMTEWERGRERDEFSRAARLYVSSHSTLSSRFTHAKEEDDSDQVEVPRDQEVGRHHSLHGEFQN